MESLSGHSWLNKLMDYFFDAAVFDTRHKMGVILAIKHLNPTRNIVVLKNDFFLFLL